MKNREIMILNPPAQKTTETIRYRLTVTGTVQGVGFRPFVYGLATACNLKGSVHNSGNGVIVDVEGPETDVNTFLTELTEGPPSLSRITDCTIDPLPCAGYGAFNILESTSAPSNECIVPPDVATCPQCRQDILSMGNRHYHYPFTNCTNCGPRFTITKEMPYDRRQTSMAAFDMCEACSVEYHSPLDRRFHAQPVACPECGPSIHMTDHAGKILPDSKDWMETCWQVLRQGKILALKGIGGFHVACDAQNKEAIRTLRERKGRDAKPFAVMCRNLNAVREHCILNEDEENLLASPQAPIVILRKRPGYSLPEGLAPGIRTLGVMLPYSPLHLLLFNGPFPVLVMTSGNYSSLPLAKENDAALIELGGIADYFLLHDRPIVNRCDDSLIQILDGEPQFLRRSRGYVPTPISVPTGEAGSIILGVGGEMKNNFCLLRKNEAFMSQYIGEIGDLEGERNLLDSLESLEGLMGVSPEIVAFDMHPGYVCSQAALRIPATHHLPVQHHHAHLAACMAENMLANENVIGVILDGTGYGADGCLWGFEILTGNYINFERRLHLAYAPLPGGEAAVKEPWRTAYSMLSTFLGGRGREYGRLLFPGRDMDILDCVISAQINSPLASSCGRLFDAVSALLGICFRNTYEGQAAIELGEKTMEEEYTGNLAAYPFDIDDGLILPGRLLEAIVQDALSGSTPEVISTRFHLSVAELIREGVNRIGRSTRIDKVALSGGTWQNHFLFRRVKSLLKDAGFEVFYHHQVPTNDGGIALGQAMIAHWQLKSGGL
jgi:hydrogenase maturation protein HypF